jgi:hypothetical protein
MNIIILFYLYMLDIIIRCVYLNNKILFIYLYIIIRLDISTNFVDTYGSIVKKRL